MRKSCTRVGDFPGMHSQTVCWLNRYVNNYLDPDYEYSLLLQKLAQNMVQIDLTGSTDRRKWQTDRAALSPVDGVILCSDDHCITEQDGYTSCRVTIVRNLISNGNRLTQRVDMSIDG